MHQNIQIREPNNQMCLIGKGLNDKNLLLLKDCFIQFNQLVIMKYIIKPYEQTEVIEII